MATKIKDHNLMKEGPRFFPWLTRFRSKSSMTTKIKHCNLMKEGLRIEEKFQGSATEVVMRCYNSKFEQTSSVYDIEFKSKMGKNFERALRKKLVNQVLYDGQKLLFEYKCNEILVRVIQILTPGHASCGLVTKETKLTVTKFGQDEIFRPSINPNEMGKELKNLGIEGMETMFTELISSLFEFRISPQDDLLINQTKGVLFHGPPGTGKTLMARRFCDIMLCVTPQIIGPEIIHDIEKNVRKLLAPAQKDYGKYGSKSPLHVFIFDDFDGIAQKRIENQGDGQQENNLFNHVCTMLREIAALPNILILATTSRKDLIDPDLLRVGRVQTQVFFDLATKDQRIETLGLKLKPLVDEKFIDKEDLDLNRLANITEGMSGAELDGLLTSVITNALDAVDFDEVMRWDSIAQGKVKINTLHFQEALEKMTT